MKFLQWVGGIVVVLVILVAIFSEPETRDAGRSGGEWYQGGTLHESTISQWNSATYKNQLATAADWTTGVIGQNEFERIGLAGVRRKAEKLTECIKGSTDGLSGLGQILTMEIGAACILLLKW